MWNCEAQNYWRKNVDELYYIKIKNFYYQRTHQENQLQDTNWEKVFIIYIYLTKDFFKKYKELAHKISN